MLPVTLLEGKRQSCAIRYELFRQSPKVPPDLADWLVQPKTIDDVPVLTLTLWSDKIDDARLRMLGLQLLQALKQVENTGNGFVVGGRQREIGILVDDATVVVENIFRRWLAGGATAKTVAIEAVGEVGNPTIIATLTVLAALLPMGFVTGMMGPYMRPIPILGSVAMLFDPIFQGMAISLLFGPIVGVPLTLIVVPLGCIATGWAFDEANQEPESGGTTIPAQ
jgi:multidrug efflux pump subunit AcrB